MSSKTFHIIIIANKEVHHKDVLPAVTGKSYDDLNIKEDGTASMTYIDLIEGRVNDKEEHARILWIGY